MTHGTQRRFATLWPLKPATRPGVTGGDLNKQTGEPWKRAWDSLRARPAHLISVVALLLMTLLAIGGPLLPLPAAEDQNLSSRLSRPMTRAENGTLHIAGTDQLGRDILSRTIAGARVSLGIALATVLVAGPIGSIVGLLAGYRGGVFDQIIMRLIDLQMAFPTLLFAVFLLYLIGASIFNLIVLLSALSWIGYARMARAQTLSLRNNVFVESAEASGCSRPRILFRHILPHLLPVLTVVAVFDFGAVMLAEAGLSFLGMGVQPPGISWGRMIAEGQAFMYSGGWWLFLIPGAAIFIVVLSARLASSWVQELLGPARGPGNQDV